MADALSAMADEATSDSSSAIDGLKKASEETPIIKLVNLIFNLGSPKRSI
jgi:hypothetical protein